MIALIHAYVHQLNDETQRRLITIALTNSKANNPKTREFAVTCAQDLLKHNSETPASEYFCGEIVNTVKAGKTTGPEHRIALYSILDALPPSQGVSSIVADALEYLFAKESNEAALFRLANSARPHIFFIISTDMSIPPNLIKAIIQDINNTSRPSARHAASLVIGNVLWECGKQGVRSKNYAEVANAAEKAFESSLSSLANTSTSPLEGYIAISSLLGPISKARESGVLLIRGLIRGRMKTDTTSDDVVTRVKSSQAIIGTTAKPSFLLSSRVYEKLSTEEDSTWFLRALQTATRALKDDLEKTSQLRSVLTKEYFHHLHLRFITI